MKRVELIKRIGEMGCIFIRHGKGHDWYQKIKNPRLDSKEDMLE